MKIKTVPILILIFISLTSFSILAKEENSDSSNDELVEDIYDEIKEESQQNIYDKKEKEIWQKYDSPHLKSEVITSSVKIEDIIESSTEYTYSSFGKSDPFVPPMMNDLISKVEIPITSSLQKFDIASLSLTGIWLSKDGQSKALIVTPEGEGIVSKIGDYIGQKGGEIIAIEDSKIKVREFIPTPDGSRQFIDMDMYIGSVQDQKTNIIKDTSSSLHDQSKNKISERNIIRQDDGYLDQTDLSKNRIKNRDFSEEKALKIKSSEKENKKMKQIENMILPDTNNIQGGGLFTLPEKKDDFKNKSPEKPASETIPK